MCDEESSDATEHSQGTHRRIFARPAHPLSIFHIHRVIIWYGHAVHSDKSAYAAPATDGAAGEFAFRAHAR